ncbi:MAG: hypothetical protein J6A04_03990 [Clostridia bacterium]|nr:hypothetical protein [Clostridia bacterium]MBP3581143.1 hypothetical protein [Clostridia bacterium]MBP3681431.1 hypothetical protein [Clostridia bacterium]
MKMKNNQGSGAIWVILIVMLLAMLTGCSGSSSSSYHDREVEKLKNELYYQAPNGKYYHK